MRNFQDTFEARKQSFISTFSICMTVPLVIVQRNDIDYVTCNRIILSFSAIQIV